MGKRVQQVLLKNLNTETLRLGYVGENVHTQIIFSCIEIYDDYPNAVATMLVQPPRGDTYPATIVRDGSRVLWDLTTSDLLYAGAGRVQLTFTNNEEIIRTIIGSTIIQDSIEGSGDPPVPVDTWVETLDTARAAAESAAEMIDGLTVTATAGQSVSATVSDVDGHKHIAFVFPTASYTFDNTPTAGSTNPVTSKGIKTALDAKQDTLSFDTEPTANSTKPVTSGGIKTALDAKQNTLTFDNSPNANSSNPVKSSGIYTALQGKQDTLTFDSQPIQNSTNPVTSGGVYAALTGSTPTIPDATSSTKGVVMIESTPTVSSTKAITSGAVAALEARVADLEYVPVAINTLSVNPSLAEIGSTVTSATLTYAMNRDATQMKLDGAAIQDTEQNGTISLTGLSLTSNKTWTLQATDERKSLQSEWVSKTTTLTFTNKVKYGVAADPGTINDSFLNGLGTRTLSTGKVRSFSVNAGSGQYIWYALPTSYGACTFTVGGFTGGFAMVSQFNHTNESGYTVEYRVYRSDNANLGNQSVSVG